MQGAYRYTDPELVTFHFVPSDIGLDPIGDQHPEEAKLIMMQNDYVIGHVDVQNYDDAYCWLSNVFVLDTLRGKGYGTRMLRHLLGALCGQQGKSGVALGVHQTNDRARRFYERLGFRPFMKGQPGYKQFIYHAQPTLLEGEKGLKGEKWSPADTMTNPVTGSAI